MADKQLWQVTPVATDVKNDDGVIIGGQTAGTRYAPLTLIANYVHNLWAAFINAITPLKTSFAIGDKIPVVNGSTATAMPKDKLLELTAQNALGSIKSLANTKYKGFMALDDVDGTGKMDVDTIFNNFAGKFDPSVTYNKYQIVIHEGSLKIFKTKHNAGAWNSSQAEDFSFNNLWMDSFNYVVRKVLGSVKSVSFVERNARNAALDVVLTLENSVDTSSSMLLLCTDGKSIDVFLTNDQKASISDHKLTLSVPYDQYLILNSNRELEVSSSVTENDYILARNIYGNFGYGALDELHNEWMLSSVVLNNSSLYKVVENVDVNIDFSFVERNARNVALDVVIKGVGSATTSTTIMFLCRDKSSVSVKLTAAQVSAISSGSLTIAVPYDQYLVCNSSGNLETKATPSDFDIIVAKNIYGNFAYGALWNRYIEWKENEFAKSYTDNAVAPLANLNNCFLYVTNFALNRFLGLSLVERNASGANLDIIFKFNNPDTITTSLNLIFFQRDQGYRYGKLTQTQIDSFDGNELKFVVPNDKYLVCNSSGNLEVKATPAATDIVVARNLYGNFAYGALWNRVFDEKIKQATPSFSAVESYKEDEIAVNSIARKGYTAEETTDFCLMLLTDTHNDNTSVERGIELSDSFGAIKAILYLGDATRSKYDLSQVTTFMNTIKKSTKPFFFVTGNHDVGFEYGIEGTASQKDIYDSFISPLVTKGWIALGEYTANKAYYYHDFADDKIRLICLYEYDVELKLEESVWEAVTYNSSYPNVVVGTTYSVGDYVNVEGYTDYSFKAKVNVDTTGGSVWNKDKLPSWTCPRGRKAIQKDQADWLASTLLSTPQDYRVIVALHNPFSATCTTDTTKLFCKDINLSGSSQILSVMSGNLIEEIVAAFIAGSTCAGQVAFTGDATYMNTEGGGTYAYNYSYDFSTKNSGVKFLNFIGGHAHADYIWKSANSDDIWQVSPMCNGFQQEYAADIRRNSSLTKYGRDSITCYAVNPNNDKVSLCKIGAKCCIDGRFRRIEIL